MIQSINVNDAMRHLKTIMNKLICLCRGHMFINWRTTYIKNNQRIIVWQCARCGKTKEVVI